MSEKLLDIYFYINGKKNDNKVNNFIDAYKDSIDGMKFHIKMLAYELLKYKGRKNEESDIMFIGNKFRNLSKYMSKKYNIIYVQIDTKEQIEFRRENTKFINFYRELEKLINNYYEENIDIKIKTLNSIVKKISSFLEKTRPKVIILWNDTLFFERTIIYCARQLNIKTVTIQHGLFQFVYPELNDGYYSDYFITWGKYIKDKYIECGIKDKNNIYVLGYPYKSFKDMNIKENSLKNKKLKVCFLGQEFRRGKENIEQNEFQLIKNVKKICEELDMEFIYRPHPGEKTKDIKNIIDNKISDKSETLANSINNNDVFLSINSTALIEAACYNKVSAEILFQGIPPYNYEKAGACYTIKNDYMEIRDFLFKCNNNDIKPMKVSSNYLYISDNIEERFLGIIEEIIDKNERFIRNYLKTKES